MGEEQKQADFCHPFSTAGHRGFIYETEIRFKDKRNLSDSTRSETFRVNTHNTCFPKVLKTIYPYH